MKSAGADSDGRDLDRELGTVLLIWAKSDSLSNALERCIEVSPSSSLHNSLCLADTDSLIMCNDNGANLLVVEAALMWSLEESETKLEHDGSVSGA